MVQKNLKTKKNSKEFDEKKKILELSLSCDKEKHQMKMEELKFIRETDRIKHEKEMERQRIKSAEIRKTMERRENKNFVENYWK